MKLGDILIGKLMKGDIKAAKEYVEHVMSQYGASSMEIDERMKKIDSYISKNPNRKIIIPTGEKVNYKTVSINPKGEPYLHVIVEPNYVFVGDPAKSGKILSLNGEAYIIGRSSSYDPIFGEEQIPVYYKIKQDDNIRERRAGVNVTNYTSRFQFVLIPNDEFIELYNIGTPTDLNIVRKTNKKY
ncbi:MAG: hypothetical protein ABGW69_01455 [Nanoarchaeota archaeon]